MDREALDVHEVKGLGIANRGTLSFAPADWEKRLF